MEKRYTTTELREYVEPLLNQAKSDSWYSEYAYVYGWRGNPIIACILQLREESAKKTERIKELESKCHHYKVLFEEAALSAKKLLGVK